MRSGIGQLQWQLAGQDIAKVVICGQASVSYNEIVDGKLIVQL